MKMGTELFFGRVGVGVTSNLISNTHIEREPAISAVKMVARNNHFGFYAISTSFL